jgi:predicted glycoside hydrolase/deacetylase ChbG (UPF0249 family)
VRQGFVRVRDVSTKCLVINADDLGFAPDINAAIEELHRAGRVTNATLMVDGNYVEDALAMVRRNPWLGVGLHLDLCPVIGFYDVPYQQMRDNLRTPEMVAKVGAEVVRQINLFKAFGLEFGHLDGHRHFHALPEVFAAVVETAAAQGLKTIRLTKDWILPRTPSCFWDESYLRSSIDLVKRHDVRFPNKFVYGWKSYDASDFEPGYNELMVHVGHEDEHYLREYELLASADFERMIQDSGVELRSYRDFAQGAR